MDLARWWADRRWKALLEMIDELPAASRFNEAVQNDPEQAELIALYREQHGDDEREPWRPRVREYDLHANLLRDAVQALIGLRAAVIASAGGKPGAVPEYPTPTTEVDKAAARLEKAWAQGVLTRFGFDPGDL